MEIFNVVLQSYRIALRKILRITQVDRTNYKRRRNCDVSEKNAIKQVNSSMDNAKTYKVKTESPKNTRIPSLISFLVIYLCLINVIIMCDANVSNSVNIMKHKREYDSTRRARHIHNDSREHRKINRKNRASLKEMEDVLAEDEELNKLINVTNQQYSHTHFEMPKYTMHDDSHAIGYPHDLASSPYYVKKTNFKLRSERHQFDEKIVKFGVLLPADANQTFSLTKVLPILEIAVKAITRPGGVLPGWKLLVDYRDTACNSAEGPLAAFEFYINGTAGIVPIYFSSIPFVGKPSRYTQLVFILSTNHCKLAIFLRY